ncbi:MAG: acyl carrier protein [Thermocrispum sp.]
MTDDGQADTRRPTVAEVAGQIGEIVAELLGRRVDVDANFFDAGLTSMTATRLHTMVRARIGTTLPVTFLYSHPTAHRAATAVVNDRQAISQPYQPPTARPGSDSSDRQAARSRSRRDIRTKVRRDLSGS